MKKCIKSTDIACKTGRTPGRGKGNQLPQIPSPQWLAERCADGGRPQAHWRSKEAEDVGRTALCLLTDLTSAVTGRDLILLKLVWSIHK